MAHQTRKNTGIGENTPFRKKLRYDRKKDPNCGCHRTEDGMYVYTRTVRRGDGWKKEVIASFNPADYPDDADITLIIAELDQLDYEEDLQWEELNEHIDKVFQFRLLACQRNEEDASQPDPWETVSYARDSRDLFDRLFPDEMPADERLARVEEFIATLRPQQIDLLYQHLGARRTLEDLRREEQERTSRPVSQQAFYDRWNKILTRACRFFGVQKPRKATTHRKNTAD